MRLIICIISILVVSVNLAQRRNLAEFNYTYKFDKFGHKKYGIKNQYGDQIIPNIYDEVVFKNNIFLVTKKDEFDKQKKGAFSLSGKELIPAVRDAINFEDSYFAHSNIKLSIHRNKFYIPLVIDVDGTKVNETVIMFFINRNLDIVDKVCLKHPQVLSNDCNHLSGTSQNLKTYAQIVLIPFFITMNTSP